MDGRAIFVIAEKPAGSNSRTFSLPNFFISATSTMKDSAADIPCAMSVAHATPAMPML